MKFLINNFKCIFYIFLLSSKQINDFSFYHENIQNYFKNTSAIYSKTALSTRYPQSNTTENNSIRNFLSICYNQFEQNVHTYSPCYVHFTACGDLNDWTNLSSKLISKIDQTGYMNLINYRKSLTERLNKVNFLLKKTDIINLVHEKQLGTSGNSYYYQKYIRKLDIPDNIYVSFKYLEHRKKYNWNQDINFKAKTCDYLELTVYNPVRHILVRKTVSKDYVQELEKEFSDLFKVQKTPHEKNTSETKLHPVLTFFKNLNYTKSKNETNNLILVNSTKLENYKNKTVNKNDSEEIKFNYRFDMDRIDELNQMYKKHLRLYSSHEDHLTNYAIIQDKITKEIYMHTRSKSGKYYLNHLVSTSNAENNFLFKFKKTTSLTLRIKSIESWNIIRYEIYIPYPNCSATSLNDNHYNQFYSATNYINCDNFDEKLFFEQLNQRGL